MDNKFNFTGIKADYYPDCLHNKYTETYYVDGLKHRIDGPAYILWYLDGTMHREHFYVKDHLHRTDGPALTVYRESGHIFSESYYIHDMFHREDGPAYIEYYNYTKQPSYIAYYSNNKMHNLSGPALITYNENRSIWSKHYYINGECIKVKSLQEFKKIVKLLMFK